MKTGKVGHFPVTFVRSTWYTSLRGCLKQTGADGNQNGFVGLRFKLIAVKIQSGVILC